MKKKRKKKRREKIVLDASRGVRPAVNMVNVWKDVLDGVIDPEGMEPRKRRGIVLVAMNGDFAMAEIAATLKVSYTTIQNDVRAIKRELGGHALETTLQEIVGDLAHSADACYSRAMASGSIGLAWKVKSDFVKLLAKLGVVQSEPERREVAIAVVDATERYRESRELLADITVPALTGEIINAGEQRGKLKDVVGEEKDAVDAERFERWKKNAKEVREKREKKKPA